MAEERDVTAGAAAPAIEVRGGDRPGLYAAGAAQPIVRVTAEDAAGYSVPWNTAMKGRRVGAPALASQSELAHDVLARDRLLLKPHRVLEIEHRHVRGKLARLLESAGVGARRV